MLNEIDIFNLEFNDLDDSGIMDNWEKFGFIKKDVCNGDLVKVKNITLKNDKTIELILTNGMNLPVCLKKERKFFDKFGIKGDALEYLLENDIQEWLDDNDLHVYINVNNYNITGSLMQAYVVNKRNEFYNEIRANNKSYTAKIKERNNGGYLVDIDGVDAFLPGSLASANKIINFNDFIGKKVDVMIEDYIPDGDTFIVSNKKYIQYILPEKINNLEHNKIYTGEITGTIKFGIFIEFEQIMTGLLHVTEMNSDTLNRFKNGEYRAGNKIDFYIKEITKEGRIILTEKNNDDNILYEEFKEKFENNVTEGEIIAIKNNTGSFVKFLYNDKEFVGLLHIKTYPQQNEFLIGDKLNFLITKVDTETKKIFLKYAK